jgi:hypothetical protein
MLRVAANAQTPHAFVPYWRDIAVIAVPPTARSHPQPWKKKRNISQPIMQLLVRYQFSGLSDSDLRITSVR